MPKRKEHSDIWKYFTKNLSDVNKAKCNFCKADISRGGKNAVSKGYTTTNMWSHLKRMHSVGFTKIDTPTTSHDNEGAPAPKKQLSATEVFHNTSHYHIDDPRAQEITKLIAEEICLDMEPLDHVNKVGFNRLLNKLCPRYQMVSRTYIATKYLPNMYCKVKGVIQGQLEGIPHLAVTTDLWASDSSSHVNSFITITAHGVTQHFEHKSFCLEVLPAQGECHNSENISVNILSALQDWKIERKVLAITTDDARNVIAASEFEIEQISCATHTLQLVLHDGLLEQSSIKEIITTARKIVGHFSHCTSEKLLKNAQKRLNIPERVLIQDVPTRWDSTFQMLERLSEQRVAIQVALPQVNCSHYLNNQQWIIVKQTVEVLRYFEEATKSFSKADATLSMVIPLVNSIIKVLQSLLDADQSKTVGQIIQDLIKEINNRFGDLEDKNIYIMSTVLDPRYKARVFRESSTALKIKDLLYSEIESPIPVSPERASARTSEPSTSSVNLWNVCKKIIGEMENYEPLSNANTVMDEVETYLKQPNIGIHEDSFLYWRQTVTFPNLKKLAMKYMSLKPATVPSERLFSTVGLIHTNLRDPLKPETLRILCFLNKNLPVINFSY